MEISFSIITVTLNSKKDLLKTIGSVQSQSNKNFSHIIKDGLSNDNTRNLDFSNFVNTFFFESRDFGVYDAMNQGFNYAKDNFIIYLNAGDIFSSKNSLEELASNIKKNPFYNIYIGGTIQIDPFKKVPLRLMGIGSLYKAIPFAQMPHPSFVIRRSILAELGKPFDSNLKIAADYKQQLLLRKKNLWRVYYLKQIISIMPIGGISNRKKKSIIKGYLETYSFSKKIYGFLAILILITKVILNIYSRFFSHNLKKDINY